MPSTNICPESAGKRPVKISARVLLPAPESPIIPMKSPLLISNDIFLSTCLAGL